MKSFLSPLDKLIRLKLKKELSQEMLISAAGFKERPITLEILKEPVSSEELSLKPATKDENYFIYESLIENEEINKQKYIAIAMFQEESLDFISLYVGPES